MPLSGVPVTSRLININHFNDLRRDCFSSPLPLRAAGTFRRFATNQRTILSNSSDVADEFRAGSAFTISGRRGVNPFITRPDAYNYFDERNVSEAAVAFHRRY